jgi:hypothetical protein
MNKLSVDLENCFGIGKFEHTFDFEKSNSILIYAPNGTMKTSFTKTFDCIAKNDKKTLPCDKIYPNRKTKNDILVDGQQIKDESILIINAEDTTFTATDKISTFIASKKLKEQYDAIYLELNNCKNEFIKKLKNASQSTDCEGELISAFSVDNDDFFKTLSSIVDKLMNKYEKFTFKYNDIFDKKKNVENFINKNQKLLEKYFDDYQNLLTKSNFFKRSKNSFGTNQAKEIEKAIDDNAFFDAGHKFVLSGNIDISSKDNLKKIIEQEISNIVNDVKLKATFDKVDKEIGANAELRAFKKVIEGNNLLLIELQHYNDFKKKYG